MNQRDEKINSIRANQNAQNGKLPKAPGFVKESFLLTLLTMFGKVSGFVRAWMLAFFFGTSIFVDAYQIAVELSMIFWHILIGSHVETSLIPLISKWRTVGNVRSANFLIRVIAYISLTLSVLIALGMIWLAPWITHIQAPSYDAEHAAIITTFIRWIAPAVPLFVACNLLGYLLATVHRFRVFTILSFFLNLGQIAFIVIVGVFHLPEHLLCVGYNLGLVLAIIALFLDARRWWPGVNRPTIERIKRVLQPFWSNYWPLLLVTILFQSRIFIDKRIVSDLGVVGFVAALGYARYIIETPFSTAGTAVIRMVLPRFSEMVALQKIDEIARDFRILTNAIIWLFMPLIIILASSAQSVIEIIFGYGAFGDDAVRYTSLAMMGYAPLLWTRMLNPLINRIFNAFGMNKTVLVTGAASIILNIALAILLVRTELQIAGVTLATSISDIFCIFIMLPRLPGGIQKGTYRSIFQWSAIGIVIFFLLRVLPQPEQPLYQLAVCSVYVFALWILASSTFKDGRDTLVLMINSSKKFLRR